MSEQSQYTFKQRWLDMAEKRAEFRDNYIKMGLKIAYYRKLKNLTQEELAEKADITLGFLGQIEAPNLYTSFSFNTLFSIAKALEIPPYKILKFDD